MQDSLIVKPHQWGYVRMLKFGSPTPPPHHGYGLVHSLDVNCLANCHIINSACMDFENYRFGSPGEYKVPNQQMLLPPN